MVLQYFFSESNHFIYEVFYRAFQLNFSSTGFHIWYCFAFRFLFSSQDSEFFFLPIHYPVFLPSTIYFPCFCPPRVTIIKHTISAGIWFFLPYRSVKGLTFCLPSILCIENQLQHIIILFSLDNLTKSYFVKNCIFLR